MHDAILNRNFLFIQNGLSDSEYKKLMPWETLNSILAQHRLSVPRLRLVKEGTDILEDTYSIEQQRRRNYATRKIIPKKLYEQLSQGASLVLDAVDELHLPIRQFNNSLERAFGTHVQANLYLSRRKVQGFATHWDDHDVLILQIHGKKNWTVFGETRIYPMFRDLHDQYNPPQTPIWNGLVNEGDILYIPRGFWHHAEALDSPSLHITIGLNRNTAFNFLDWFKDNMYKVDFFRQDLPLPEQEEALAKHYEIFKNYIVQELENVDFKKFYSHERAMLKARPSFSYPIIFNENVDELNFDNFCFRLNLTYFPTISEDKEEILFSCDGKEWRLNKNTLPFFKLMQDFSSHSYEKIKICLSEIHSEKDIKGFLFAFLEQGLLIAEKSGTNETN